ncbi:MAG: phage holin family protein [Bacteroidetes bacterium]|nr:phage holin family protein [Bacteroidota bacterium]MBL0064482.1 phage holin family protein [Bacteroidota bacterium]MBL0137591.1 phage holin family protein [Bacteroidota bacterium]
MEFLGRLFMSALAVIVTALILPGVHIDGALTALIVAAVLSLLNAIVKPILVFLTIPITLLSLGLFLLVINAGMILLVDKLVDGFHVQGFWTALFFSIILSLVTSIFSSFNSKEQK